MLRYFYITAVLLAVSISSCLHAQDDEVPLGDIARAYRNSKPHDLTSVIDDDNLVPMMDKAETERLEGKPVSSIKSGIFTTVSPDGSCSLSFDSRSVNPTATVYIATDLPQDEVLKLEGPAVIQNGEFAVSVHNGTHWDVKELVVGITRLQAQATPPEYRFATLNSTQASSAQKVRDPMTLYHHRGSVGPDSTAIFHAPIDRVAPDAQDWHWAIVGARGIPPAAQGLLRSQILSPPSLTSPSQSSTSSQLALPAQETTSEGSQSRAPADTAH